MFVKVKLTITPYIARIYQMKYVSDETLARAGKRYRQASEAIAEAQYRKTTKEEMAQIEKEYNSSLHSLDALLSQVGGTSNHQWRRENRD